MKSWKDNYDRCMMDCEGDLIIFGEHCNLQQARKIIDDDKYDDPEDWYEPENIWLRFCLFSYEGEPTNGFLELVDEPESMRGCIVATRLKNNADNVNKDKGD